MFANDRQQGHNRVAFGMTNLPKMDIQEKRRVKSKLDIIRDNIRDLKKIQPRQY